jgi:DNA polymerase III epsilon subunit
MFVLDSKGKRIHRTVVFDVETTGLFPDHGDRVIEIGAVELRDGRVVDEFESLINVDQPIHPMAQKIHGITKEMLEGKPSASMIVPKFHKFIMNSVLVAHNANYDMRFIGNEFAMMGLLFNNVYFCTMSLGRSIYPELHGHDLESLYLHFYKRPPKRLHRALDDARTTAKIWLKMDVKV